MSYFGIFRLAFEKKKLLSPLKQPQFFKTQSFIQNSKFLNLGPKLPYLGVLSSNLKSIAIFEISTLKFAKIRNFMQN